MSRHNCTTPPPPTHTRTPFFFPTHNCGVATYPFLPPLFSTKPNETTGRHALRTLMILMPPPPPPPPSHFVNRPPSAGAAVEVNADCNDKPHSPAHHTAPYPRLLPRTHHAHTTPYHTLLSTHFRGRMFHIHSRKCGVLYAIQQTCICNACFFFFFFFFLYILSPPPFFTDTRSYPERFFFPYSFSLSLSLKPVFLT